MEKRTTDNVSSYTLIQQESYSLKSNSEYTKSIAAEMAWLIVEQHKWIY